MVVVEAESSCTLCSGVWAFHPFLNPSFAISPTREAKDISQPLDFGFGTVTCSDSEDEAKMRVPLVSL